MSDCDCPYCIECPKCGHRADEHMAGDFTCGICYMCERNRTFCDITDLERFAEFDTESFKDSYVKPIEKLD